MNVRSGLRWTKVRPIWDFINIFHFTNSIFYQLEKVIVLCTYSSILLAHMCLTQIYMSERSAHYHVLSLFFAVNEHENISEYRSSFREK